MEEDWWTSIVPGLQLSESPWAECRDGNEEEWREGFSQNKTIRIDLDDGGEKFVDFLKALDPTTTSVKHIIVVWWKSEALLDALLLALVPFNLASLKFQSGTKWGYHALRELLVAGKLRWLKYIGEDEGVEEVLAEVIEKNAPSIHLTFFESQYRLYSLRLVTALKSLPSLKVLLLHAVSEICGYCGLYNGPCEYCRDGEGYGEGLLELLKERGSKMEFFGNVGPRFAAAILEQQCRGPLGLGVVANDSIMLSNFFSAVEISELQHLSFFSSNGPCVSQILVQMCTKSPPCLTSFHLDIDVRHTSNYADIATESIFNRLFTSPITRFRGRLNGPEILKGLLHSLQSGKSKLQHFLLHDAEDYVAEDEADSAVVQIVAYLERNFQCPLETLLLPIWPSPELEAYCKQMLSRNEIYRQGGLKNQVQVEPSSAKVFICGDSGAGKSTIRSNLVSRFPTVRCKGLLSTFGIDMATLKFKFHGGKRGKLLICDLAGQPEFHGFHHYFIRGSDKDLFIIVCRAPPESPRDTRLQVPSIHQQLSYWLRFLVSHRTLAKHQPKVMVILNFFPDSAYSSFPELTDVATDLCESIVHNYSIYINCIRRPDSVVEPVKNIYGANAKSWFQVRRTVQPALQENFRELLQARPKLPKVCFDILQALPQICKTDKVLSIQELKMKVRTKVNMGETEFEVILKFLHDMGEVIYFDEQHIIVKDINSRKSERGNVPQNHPPSTISTTEDKYVILDVQWFVRDIVGLFLPRMVRPGDKKSSWINLHCLRSAKEGDNQQSGVMDKGEAKVKLKTKGCHNVHIPHIMRSLQKMGVLLDDPKNNKLTVIPLLPHQDPTWPQYSAYSAEKKAMYWGRRLDCADVEKTLLPSAIFEMLQVKLSKRFQSQEVFRGWINLVENDIGLIIKVGGSRNTWYDRHWIDILVQIPSHRTGDIYLEKAEQAFQEVKSCVLEICRSYNWGCPLVELIENVIQPKSVEELDCKQVALLSSILQKADEEEVSFRYSDSNFKSTPLYEIMLPSERKEQLDKRLKQLESVREQIRHVHKAATGDQQIDEDAEELDKPATKRDVREIVKEMREVKEDILGALERLEKIVMSEAQFLKNQGRIIISQLLVGSKLKWPKYPYLLSEERNQFMELVAGRKYKLYFCCEYGHYQGDEFNELPVHEVKGALGFSITAGPDWRTDEGSSAVLCTSIRTVFLVLQVVGAVVAPIAPFATIAAKAEQPLLNAIKSEVDFKSALQKLFGENLDPFTATSTDEQRNDFYMKLETQGLRLENFVHTFGLHEVKTDNGSIWVCEKHRHK